MIDVVYAIGDIHGMSDMLRDRLAAVRRHADAHGIARPRTVFLGDYIDRGPDSKGVLDLLSDPSAEGGPAALELDPVFLLGNHEEFLIEALGGRFDGNDLAVWLQHNGGSETLASYGADTRRAGPRDALNHADEWLPRSHRDFLGSLRLSWREGGLFFSHAGIAPGQGLDEQTRTTLLYGDSQMFDYDHEWLAPKLRETLGARVVHGHWTEMSGVEVWPHRIGVDTGAGYAGGRLSAIALDGQGGVEVLS